MAILNIQDQMIAPCVLFRNHDSTQIRAIMGYSACGQRRSNVARKRSEQHQNSEVGLLRSGKIIWYVESSLNFTFSIFAYFSLFYYHCTVSIFSCVKRSVRLILYIYLKRLCNACEKLFLNTHAKTFRRIECIRRSSV